MGAGWLLIKGEWSDYGSTCNPPALALGKAPATSYYLGKDSAACKRGEVRMKVLVWQCLLLIPVA